MGLAQLIVSSLQREDSDSSSSLGHFSFCWYLIIQPSTQFSENDMLEEKNLAKHKMYFFLLVLFFKLSDSTVNIEQ